MKSYQEDGGREAGEQRKQSLRLLRKINIFKNAYMIIDMRTYHFTNMN